MLQSVDEEDGRGSFVCGMELKHHFALVVERFFFLHCHCGCVVQLCLMSRGHGSSAVMLQVILQSSLVIPRCVLSTIIAHAG